MGADDYFSASRVHMNPDSPIWIEKSVQMKHVEFHAHEFTEVAFVATGSALHHHTDKSGQNRTRGLVQGDLFSVLPGEGHSYESCQNMILYNLYLDSRFLEMNRHLQNLPGWAFLFGQRLQVPDIVLHLSATVRNWAVQCLDRALYECRLMPPGFETLAPALALEFLIVATRSKEFKSSYIGGESLDILRSVSSIEENPASHFSLEQLAGTARMSVSSYTKKFRQATGVSPMEYVLRLRLQQVCHYLTASALSIGEITALCGFCSPNYLIKLFRRQLGITPAQYRKEWRENLRAGH